LQTALRDVIGKTMLSEMLEGRDKMSAQLQKIIDDRTEPLGINVISVEVKDVLIPSSLEDAMSMQAQAERERQRLYSIRKYRFLFLIVPKV
jgi:regulator of protease activity HflC (stomatin/prohibitin superfamily)